MTSDPLHGHTLADITDLAATVVARHRHWWSAGDVADQRDAAWEGIVTYLCEASEPPGRNDLLRAGLQALNAHVRGDLQSHGYGSHNDIANAGARFAAFWEWHSAPAPDPQAAVTERVAVTQILPLLTARQREALELLAACGGYQEAATAMGVGTGTFQSHIQRARRSFLALWHEGEAPSRIWRMDKRVRSRRSDATTDHPCGTVQAYWQHKRRREDTEGCGCREAHNDYQRARYAAKAAA